MVLFPSMLLVKLQDKNTGRKLSVPWDLGSVKAFLSPVLVVVVSVVVWEEGITGWSSYTSGTCFTWPSTPYSTKKVLSFKSPEYFADSGNPMPPYKFCCELRSSYQFLVPLRNLREMHHLQFLLLLTNADSESWVSNNVETQASR